MSKIFDFSDAIDVLSLPHRANFFSGIPARRSRTKLDETSGFTQLDSREHPLFSAFPLWNFRWLGQLQHEHHHELTSIILELLFQSLLVGSSKLVCLDPASKRVALPTHSDYFERFLPVGNFVFFTQSGLMKWVQNQFVLREGLEYPPTLPYFGGQSIRARNL